MLRSIKPGFANVCRSKHEGAVGRVLLACCKNSGCRGIGFEVNTAAVEKARAQACAGVQHN